MAASNFINRRYPILGQRLGRLPLATLPTPVRQQAVQHCSANHTLLIKCDSDTGALYGGNKVRKLEYMLATALEHGCERIATFGTTGSHHALATALYAKSLGLSCTCFLAHQHMAPGIRETLLTHLDAGTEIIRYGGARTARLQLLRENLWHRNCWLIPAGGSSWLGTMGFVNAGLELAAQINRGECDRPDRIYVATGTMGTTAGLALGLALAGIDCQLEAVRVSVPAIANPVAMHRLLSKTVTMMRRLDPAIPTNLAEKTRIRFREDFFAGGYAHSDTATDYALEFARNEAGLELEATYTGKAFAAVLADLATHPDERLLFWNTYHGAPLPAAESAMDRINQLPTQFRRYLLE